MSDEKQIFTLKQVAASIQKAIAERYNRLYWIKAEMHKLNYTGKGHCYPELVHKEDGKLVAEMRGTIWKSSFEKISRQFAEVVKEPLRDGLTLLFLAKISYHPLYGMGLEIVDIDPVFTLGELQKEREETLKKLTKEGVLNANQQLPFPLLPKRIALISVDSSKGLSDFYSVARNNKWGYTFFFMLFTAQLNGDAAVASIRQQLKRIEKVRHHFDAVAIIRGGGGEIGLSCYNNYELSRDIATFPLPVLTGIGHSTNITVCEMVAFRNAITPTELADFLLQSFHDFAVPVQEARQKVTQQSRQILGVCRQELNNELRIFRNVTSQGILNVKQVLTACSRELQVQSKFRFRRETGLLNTLAASLKNGARNRRGQEQQKIERSGEDLRKSVRGMLQKEAGKVSDSGYFVVQQLPKIFTKEQQSLLNLEKQVRLMDPRQVLKRGYSISLLHGKTISADNPAREGDQVETITFDQHLLSEVKEIKNTNDE